MCILIPILSQKISHCQILDWQCDKWANFYNSIPSSLAGFAKSLRNLFILKIGFDKR